MTVRDENIEALLDKLPAGSFAFELITLLQRTQPSKWKEELEARVGEEVKMEMTKLKDAST